MANEIKKKDGGLDFFGRYLTIWVALCIIVGVAIGQMFPAFPKTLSKFEYAQVSIPVAILIWLMIYPMMLKIDFSSKVESTNCSTTYNSNFLYICYCLWMGESMETSP